MKALPRHTPGRGRESPHSVRRLPHRVAGSPPAIRIPVSASENYDERSGWLLAVLALACLVFYVAITIRFGWAGLAVAVLIPSGLVVCLAAAEMRAMRALSRRTGEGSPRPARPS